MLPLPAADIVPYNLVVYLGPTGTLTVWTAILLATYAGFISALWQLLAWTPPSLALGPREGALYLGSLAALAWRWAPTLCWAAPILYSFDAVCHLGVKVAALQDRVRAVEGRETQLMGRVTHLEGRVTYLEGSLEVAGEPRLVRADWHLLHARLQAPAASAVDCQPWPTRFSSRPRLAAACLPQHPLQAAQWLPDSLGHPAAVVHATGPCRLLAAPQPCALSGACLHVPAGCPLARPAECFVHM